MHNVREISKNLYWIGANDRRLELFENIHPIPEGVSYNSYMLLDEKTVVLDTVDWSVCRQFLTNIEYLLDGRKLDFLIVNHVEPDHAACIEEVLLRYPDVKIICTEKAFMLMNQFGFDLNYDSVIEVKEGDTMSFGKHEFAFVEAPMVHWPEAMVSFDTTTGTLFAADAFGSFGTLDGRLFNDELDFDKDWIEPARRYYTNIVGKYGPHVQALLKKASGLDIKTICSLHGPVWRSDLGYILDKYDKWSSYTPEEEGVLLIYASMYGNTEAAAEKLALELVKKGITNVKMYDASKTDVSYLVSETFKYSHLVIASPTYNLEIYPAINQYLDHIKALNIQKRTVAIIENGSWAPQSGDKIREKISEMPKMNILSEELSITSALNDTDITPMENLADAIVKSMEDK